MIRFPENEAMIRAVVTGGGDKNVYPTTGNAVTPPSHR